jgi:organic radical activating enzyme
MINTLSLSYTFQCPARCELCCTSSSPDNTEKMDLQTAQKYLLMAKEIAGLKWLAITGGESLIFFEDICKILTLAKEYGLKTKVVTNAFWAKNEKTTNTSLHRLKKSGLDFLGISTDVYHRSYIPLNYIHNCLKGARELGIAHEIAFVWGEVGREENELILKSLKLDSEGIFISDKLAVLDTETLSILLGGRPAVILMPSQPFGRGCNHRDHMIWLPAEEFKNALCPMIGRILNISPLGDAYWCCCVFGYGKTYNHCYKVGNLNELTLQEIDNQLSKDPVVDFLAFQGPYELFRHLKARGVQFPDQFSCTCELCLQSFLKADKSLIESIAKEQILQTQVMKCIRQRAKELERSIY